MFQHLVKAGYNQVAAAYNHERDQLKSSKYLNKLLQHLPAEASILDLGCGMGIPIDRDLLKKNHLVTGIDIAETQIALAKKNCPTGNFLVKDISQLRPYEYRVDAVVSFYTFFHLPRTTHHQLLSTIATFLPKHGWLLITMGDRDFEGVHDFYGTKMWSSHYAPAKNFQLVTQAGFQIRLDEIDSSGREKHQIILAEKISNY